MNTKNIEISEESIGDFCAKRHIVSMSLFGSVLRDDFGPDSDVDVLIEFEAGHEVGLLTFARMENELSDVLNRKVHLNTSSSLSPYFRDEVIQEAETLYVAA